MLMYVNRQFLLNNTRQKPYAHLDTYVYCDTKLNAKWIWKFNVKNGCNVFVYTVYQAADNS